MMYEVHADTTKNRLYITLEGFFTDEYAAEASEAIKAEVDKLQTGFDVINDMRTFKPGSPKAAMYIVEVQKYEVAHGINQIMRVLGNEIVGQMQFERLTKETGIVVKNATSIEEADMLLDRESVLRQ